MTWFDDLPYDLAPVRIDWRDSCTDASWRSYSPHERYAPVIIHSLGFVLHHDEDYVTIAQSMDEQDPPSTAERLSILTSAIVDVTFLNYKKVP